MPYFETVYININVNIRCDLCYTFFEVVKDFLCSKLEQSEQNSTFLRAHIFADKSASLFRTVADSTHTCDSALRVSLQSLETIAEGGQYVVSAVKNRS